MRGLIAPLMLAIAAPAMAQSGEVPEVPSHLSQYVEDSRFRPGDWAWLEGAFEDAGPQAQAEYAAYQQWLRECHEQALARLQAEVAEAGFADAPLEGVSAAPVLCREASRPWLENLASYSEFRAELDSALPIIESYLFAVEQAQLVSQPRVGEGVDAQLRWRVLGDQMVRRALFWQQATAQGAPELSPIGQAIAQAMLANAMARQDYENTRWLRSYVDENGWPRISEVGERASHNAWLLVQHADHDPLFQLRVLRAMEPMLDDGEVNSRNYAYLYDRIMLKLAGSQRYATQMGCVDGELVPRELEQPDAVDELREAVGLDPIADYLASMREMSTCPPPAAEADEDAQ